ncbi:MAG: hypothetical protein H6719_20635 [Sandaracinaceae bacterium]|nr:hypothetical protein [Sandaracinaceae bacterium]
MGVKATVTNGRLVMDEPTTLPEGTVLELVIDDEGDELDDRERAALDAAISESLRQAANGDTVPADDVLAKLRARRGR